jgi:hypothetical protein
VLQAPPPRSPTLTPFLYIKRLSSVRQEVFTHRHDRHQTSVSKAVPRVIDTLLIQQTIYAKLRKAWTVLYYTCRCRYAPTTWKSAPKTQAGGNTPRAPTPTAWKSAAKTQTGRNCGLLATGVFSGDSVSRHPGALSSQHEARVVYLELTKSEYNKAASNNHLIRQLRTVLGLSQKAQP